MRISAGSYLCLFSGDEIGRTSRADLWSSLKPAASRERCPRCSCPWLRISPHILQTRAAVAPARELPEWVRRAVRWVGPQVKEAFAVIDVGGVCELPADMHMW